MPTSKKIKLPLRKHYGKGFDAKCAFEADCDIVKLLNLAISKGVTAQDLKDLNLSVMWLDKELEEMGVA